MDTLWRTDRQGFVTCYMVSGPKAEPYTNDHRDTQQIRYEAWLRSVIADHAPVEDTEHIRLGQESRLGQPWRYHYDMGSGFIDCSAFYSEMRRVTFDVACCVVAERAMEVPAVLWSYAAVDLYCNGVKLGQIDHPDYKPIERLKVTLPLRAGRNILYMACCNLGVRDTRSTVAIQLLSDDPALGIALPDETCETQIARADRFLSGTVQEPKRLVFPEAAQPGSSLLFRRPRRDEDTSIYDPDSMALDGLTEAVLPEGVTYVTLCVPAAGATLRRTFERTEQMRPVCSDASLTPEQELRAMLESIAQVRSCPRGEGIHFPMAPMLARKALGQELPEDPELYAYTLTLLRRRVDCADFMLCGLLRYILVYGIPAGQEETTKEALLGFRYWMDMDGFDGMCFWSENHALMFYTGAMLAGQLYPDDWFPRAARTGRELYAWGCELTRQWLDDVEAHGFEEFLSTVYANVTFAAILGVVDFGPKDLADRAWKVTDRLLELLATHTFKTGIIAPMGRVYRNALHPFMAGAMALMDLAEPGLPYAFGEGWIGFMAGSRYRIPESLRALIDAPAEKTYTTGNARIVLEKTADWCMTSVQSPRRDVDFRRWENETLLPEADQHTHSYTKSFNERFHGTTCFQPGVYGYQQHMWYAALDGEAIVFANHPGSMSENGDMRPGYWHGNGVMPAVRQEKGVLGAVYAIPEEHPIHYTHLYVPLCRYDEVRREGHWMLLRKGEGMLAVWCSGELEAFSNMNAGCEWRTYGDEIAYLAVAGGREDGSFERFIERARSMAPTFDGRTLRAGTMDVTWTRCEDKTQYL